MRRSARIMDSIVNRVKRSLAQRGPVETVQMCWYSFYSLVDPAARKREALRQAADEEFDRKWGVETRGLVRPNEKQVLGQNWAYGVSYQAVDAARFGETMDGLGIDYSDYVFLDYGSGKGRAVLLAVGYPFKKVIGIEYCPDLHRISVENLRRYKGKRACADVELACMDATQFELPNEPLVMFFFNPFGKPVMEAVVRKVADSFRKHPRPIEVVYFTPDIGEAWDECTFLSRSGHDPVIFSARPNDPAARRGLTPEPSKDQEPTARM
jgi:hypothetical protein